MKAIILFIILLTSMHLAYADTQITVRDQRGHTSTFSSDGKSARMDDSQQPGYVLIDFTTNRLQMVEPESREIMDMGAMGNSADSAIPARVNIEFFPRGKGPVIAGYQTGEYQMQANGKNCGTIYGSKKVLELKGVAQIFSALSQLQRQTQNMAGAFHGSRDDCAQADLQMSDSLQTTGVPLRMLDEQGQVENEVISINTRASHPASFYQAPKSYRVTNVQQQMDQAGQHNREMMRQMQDSMPDMNKLMQQIQQQQGMPPEALERMKEMQDMLKQQLQQE